jgi:FkbM family methyltransferase
MRMMRRAFSLMREYPEAMRTMRRAYRARLREHRGRTTIHLPGGAYRLAWGSRHSSPQADHGLLFRLARDRSCVFDVGAKVGVTAMCMAGAMSSGTVYAFEAAESSCFVIDRNIRLNGLEDRIVAVNTTVGAASGDLCTYHWNPITGFSGVVMAPPEGATPIRKLMVSLDDFTQQCGLRPDLVKIDVEGAELAVLGGMQGILRDVRPDVVLELHAWPGMPATAHVSRILTLLATVNYRMFWLATGQYLEDAEALADLEEPAHVLGQTRFLLLPNGRPLPACVETSPGR